MTSEALLDRAEASSPSTRPDDERTKSPAQFRYLGTETVELTPEIVRRFLALTPAPTERPRVERRLKFLRDKVENGLAIPFRWAEVVVRDHPGVVYRANGQHSSIVLAEYADALPRGLFAHIERYEVENDTSQAVLFRQFDAAISGRNPSDTAGAFQGLHPNLRELDRMAVKLAAEGIAWFDKQVRKAEHVQRGNERYALLNDNELHPAIIWLASIFSIKTPELNRPPVAAAAYATFVANPEEAKAFWREVARGDDPETHARLLDTWLQRVKKKETKATESELYEGCISVWKSYRKGSAVPSSVRHAVDKKRGLSDAQ